MQFPKFLLSSIVLLLLIGCSSENDQNNDTLPLTAETRMNVSYGADPQQVYDIYLPAGRTEAKTKVIVLIHGGGWTGGDKTDMQEFIPILQQSHPKHAIVNMNYILATTTIPAFPNQFLDVERVIDKLTAESESLQILPQFGLIGTSAGAHLALQYDYVYDTNNRVKMVCDIVGATDFTDPFYAENPNFQVALGLLVDESAYPNGANYAELISPALQVSAASSPSILFYGNEDPLVPLTNGQTLQTALSNAQITHSFSVYDGGHGDDWSVSSTADLRTKLSAFINTHLAIQ
ncbi:acetyl esterase/lipase [Ulvibacter sp. MAR_2010_11]|uniref:alpha/beta hydrolase n=1 Tax=Ulvibacter sp. MAR_2010_11 TaxID=1250229 RepID=UPI000C2B7C7C|nr:alpha/beta hydrolase [Ulvibacter sp. MAR_2010_11]PKA84565.1 acetyl esterase/lipase [Ulvibacter sp. MAR_2010_11]